MKRIERDDIIKVRLTPGGVKGYYEYTRRMPEIDQDGFTTMRADAFMSILHNADLVMGLSIFASKS